MKIFSLFKPGDFLIFSGILLASIFLFSQNEIHGDSVRVNVDGTLYEYSLNKNGTFEVEGALGKTVFQIEKGKVRIIESSCPGKNCIHEGYGETLVCLPNKVIISVTRKQEKFDAISR